jgi:hypothetical protein
MEYHGISPKIRDFQTVFRTLIIGILRKVGKYRGKYYISIHLYVYIYTSIRNGVSCFDFLGISDPKPVP